MTGPRSTGHAGCRAGGGRRGTARGCPGVQRVQGVVEVKVKGQGSPGSSTDWAIPRSLRRSGDPRRLPQPSAGDRSGSPALYLGAAV